MIPGIIGPRGFKCVLLIFKPLDPPSLGIFRGIAALGVMGIIQSIGKKERKDGCFAMRFVNQWYIIRVEKNL
jgi:hypothetical protein